MGTYQNTQFIPGPTPKKKKQSGGANNLLPMMQFFALQKSRNEANADRDAQNEWMNQYRQQQMQSLQAERTAADEIRKAAQSDKAAAAKEKLDNQTALDTAAQQETNPRTGKPYANYQELQVSKALQSEDFAQQIAAAKQQNFDTRLGAANDRAAAAQENKMPLGGFQTQQQVMTDNGTPMNVPGFVPHPAQQKAFNDYLSNGGDAETGALIFGFPGSAAEGLGASLPERPGKTHDSTELATHDIRLPLQEAKDRMKTNETLLTKFAADLEKASQSGANPDVAKLTRKQYDASAAAYAQAAQDVQDILAYDPAIQKMNKKRQDAQQTKSAQQGWQEHIQASQSPPPAQVETTPPDPPQSLIDKSTKAVDSALSWLAGKIKAAQGPRSDEEVAAYMSGLPKDAQGRVQGLADPTLGKFLSYEAEPYVQAAAAEGGGAVLKGLFRGGGSASSALSDWFNIPKGSGSSVAEAFQGLKPAAAQPASSIINPGFTRPAPPIMGAPPGVYSPPVPQIQGSAPGIFGQQPAQWGVPGQNPLNELMKLLGGG